MQGHGLMEFYSFLRHNILMNKTVKILLGCCLGLFAAVVVYFLAIYFVLFRPNFTNSRGERTAESETVFFNGKENYEKHLADAKWLNETAGDRLEISSFDGLKLKAIYLEAERDCQGTVLLMHGFKSGPVREFATLARLFHEMNFNVVLPFQRAHGESEGSLITFGIKERFDCRDWIKKINSLYGEDFPVFVGGISMGCATVTMSCGFDYPENVRGFIADCGFTSPWEITWWTATKLMNIPDFLATIFVNSMDFIGRVFFDYPLKGFSSFEGLSTCSRPVLFISGTDDWTVPCEMTVNNFLFYKNIQPDNAELLLVEGAPHAISYMYDSERYNNAVINFISKNK